MSPTAWSTSGTTMARRTSIRTPTSSYTRHGQAAAGVHDERHHALSVVAKFYFRKCSGNGLTDWTKPHRPRCSRRTACCRADNGGRAVLDAARRSGACAGRQMLLVEGADGVGHTRRFRSRSNERRPSSCTRSTANAAAGKRLPAARVFPAGKARQRQMARRIKVGDQPWHFRSETARYTDPMPDGKWRQFAWKWTPSRSSFAIGRTKLAGAGLTKSAVWRVRPRQDREGRRVVDGGKNWREAALEPPVLTNA